MRSMGISRVELSTRTAQIPVPHANHPKSYHMTKVQPQFSSAISLAELKFMQRFAKGPAILLPETDVISCNASQDHAC